MSRKSITLDMEEARRDRDRTTTSEDLEVATKRMYATMDMQIR